MGEHIRDMSPIEIKQSFFINAGWIIQDIERLLDNNRYARICVIGSESGYKWSYDGAYAASKAALHRFIETKRLKYPMQQLVGIAPSCIEDSPSIQNRTEDGKKALVERVKNHPKKRWLTAMEVAQAVNYMMFIDQGYTSGVVLRMNGGEHCGDRW
jgi:NAD(P)-dependent dehydrogenase (short-subunit alcohol dehydrogenase family)